MNYLRIKKNYELSLWTEHMVRYAFERGYLTEYEYNNIINHEPLI